VAKKSKRPRRQRSWTRTLTADLKRHSKAKTPVAKLEKLFKRTGGALRQKALSLGLSLGHKRRKKRS
jgi:hypothetical protein